MRKYWEASEIFRRIRSNLNFTQSLSQYFAMDDMNEPVTCVTNEAIRNGPNLGASLRGGTVASCTQVYRHMASRFDHDNISQNRSFTSSKRNIGKDNSDSRNLLKKYKVGFCFNFQRLGNCRKNDCEYKHECSECQSTSHGYEQCQSK